MLVTSVGSRGDVQPMLAIAQGLAARGHEALVAAPPDFEAWTRALGFDFVPLGVGVRAFLEQHHAALGANPVRFFRVSRAMFAAELPAQVRTLMQAARGCDAIVFAGGSVMAPSVGEKLGIPVLGVFFTTAMLPSPQHAPVMVPWRRLPRWMNRAFWAASGAIWNALLRDALDAARRLEGLPPVRDVTQHLFISARFVMAVDRAVFPPEAEWEERVPFVGFLYLEPRERALDPELEAWLGAGEQPVYVGFGSMTGRGPARMREILVDAIGSTGHRALVGAGWAKLGGELPRGWRIVGEAPHALLFPRMACVVHHGGAGTTAAALRAGVPQVIVPLILDQYHHAQRLHDAGLAPRAIPMERIDATGLANAIRAAMSLPPGPRAAVADRLRASNAAKAIACEVEALVAARASRSPGGIIAP